jgi:hypothetical protein
MKSFFKRALAIGQFFVLCASSIATAEELKCEGNKNVVDKCFDLHGRVYLSATSEIVIWRIGTKRLLGVPTFGDILNEDYTERLEGTAVPLPPQLQSLIEQDMVIFGDFTVCPFTHSKPKVQQYVCIARATNLFPMTEKDWVALQNGSKK